MDISNNQPNNSETTPEPNNNDFSNIDNILEEYITSILASQPLNPSSLSEAPEQNSLPSPPIPPIQLTPFSDSTPLENDPMFLFMNQLFSVPRTRHVAPYNPSDNILLQSFNENKKRLYKT